MICCIFAHIAFRSAVLPDVIHSWDRKCNFSHRRNHNHSLRPVSQVEALVGYFSRVCIGFRCRNDVCDTGKLKKIISHYYTISHSILSNNLRTKSDCNECCCMKSGWKFHAGFGG
jgi:hypothetical protein